MFFSTKKRLYFDVKNYFAGKSYFKAVKTATKRKNAILLTCAILLAPLGVQKIFSQSEFSQKKFPRPPIETCNICFVSQA